MGQLLVDNLNHPVIKKHHKEGALLDQLGKTIILTYVSLRRTILEIYKSQRKPETRAYYQIGQIDRLIN